MYEMCIFEYLDYTHKIYAYKIHRQKYLSFYAYKDDTQTTWLMHSKKIYFYI